MEGKTWKTKIFRKIMKSRQILSVSPPSIVKILFIDMKDQIHDSFKHKNDGKTLFSNISEFKVLRVESFLM